MRLRNVILGFAVGAALGLAAPSYAENLPDSIRTGSRVDTSAIDNYVKAQVALMTGPDAKKASQARDDLWKQAENPLQGQISAEFQIAYVRAVSTHLPPVIKSQKLADRLNGAIVVSRLASSTRQNDLRDLANQLLQDASPAVSIYGVKAAGALIPSVLGVALLARDQKLTENVVNVVSRNQATGPLVDDAYRALDQSDNKDIPPAGKAVCTAALLDVMKRRVDLYQQAAPNDPQYEIRPLGALSKGDVFAAANAELRVRIVQTTSDLLAVAAQRFAEYPPADKSDARNRLLEVVRIAAGALRVQIERSGVPSDAKSAVATATRTMAEIDRNPGQVANAIKSVVAAVKQGPEFAGLKDPPTVQPKTAAAASN